jgi:carbonic anhydrase/acetyltransferase-like protein (isoleucine patch superfamily)
MTVLRPDVTVLPFEGKVPVIADSAFIAPGVRIIGDVLIGEEASVWYNCVLRGDTDQLVIGARSNIQDGSVLHADPGMPTIIGEDVLVGHMVMLHGCTLEDRAFVGLSSIVMNGCVIEGDGMLAAGAMLTSGKRILSRELWGGSPARKMRDLDDAAVFGMRAGTAHYVQNGKRHAAALSAHETS